MIVEIKMISIGTTKITPKNRSELVFFGCVDRKRPVLGGPVRSPQYLGRSWTGCGPRLRVLGAKNRTEPDLKTLPVHVEIGSNDSLPMKGNGVTKLSSGAMSVVQENLQHVCDDLIEYARPLCIYETTTLLPPLRKINHRIPIIDQNKSYKYHPSRCPDALKPLRNEKHHAYLKSGCWHPTTSFNTTLMLFLQKPGKPREPIRLHCVNDLDERNANTHKIMSPLPDMDGILRRVSRAKYRSVIDLQNAFEQIQIDPCDVENSAMATPDGPMLSEVLQQGDCNAPATFQTVMNDLFAPYLGRFIDIYLDDVMVYSENLEDHVKHVRLVIDILRREKFFLTKRKLNYLCEEVKILGRVVDDEGIHMDPTSAYHFE
jgi:hypothetical protein